MCLSLAGVPGERHRQCHAAEDGCRRPGRRLGCISLQPPLLAPPRRLTTQVPASAGSLQQVSAVHECISPMNNCMPARMRSGAGEKQESSALRK